MSHCCRRDIVDIVEGLSRLDGVDDLALTTNATRLNELAEALRGAGLRRITVSLDSLDDDVFRVMNGNRGDVATVLRGIDKAMTVGFDPGQGQCHGRKG